MRGGLEIHRASRGWRTPATDSEGSEIQWRRQANSFPYGATPFTRLSGCEANMVRRTARRGAEWRIRVLGLRELPEYRLSGHTREMSYLTFPGLDLTIGYERL